MPFALVNANTSSPLTKPPVISTVAPSIFVSSESLSVNAASMTAAAPDSVYERVPPAPPKLGASLSAAATVIVE